MFKRIKKHRLNAVLFVMMAVMLLLAACGSGAQTNTETPNANQGATPAPEQTPEVRKIEHAMGTAEIPGTPQRVVVLTNDGSDITLALGVKPVGAVRHWTGTPNWYAYLKDKMEGVVLVGEETQPNIEEIIKLQPDLILGSKLRHEKIYEQLKAVAPTVMTETVGTTWKENTLLYGKALNKEAEVNKLIADWDARVTDFKSKMGDKLNTEISIVRFQATEARIYYQGFPGSILKEVGLARPEKQRVTDKVVLNLTLEQIPEMDGDVIFYFVATGDADTEAQAKKTFEDWTNNELWKNLKAVKAGKVVQVDEVFWNMTGGIQGANKMLDDLYKHFEIQ